MKNNQRVFFLLFGFFVVVALGSLVVLDGKGSAFERSRSSMGATTAALSETTVIGDTKSDEATEVASLVEPTSVVPETTEVPEAAAEISIEVPDELVEEALGEEPETEITVDADAITLEPADEPAPESGEYEVRYLTFKVNTQGLVLRLRDGPSEDAEVIAKLGMQSVGYVLKPGNEWCKVYTASGKTGYCATEYLLMEEATIDDYPAKVRDQIEAPDEKLDF